MTNGVECKIIKDKAETIYVQHPTSSYGIFCFNSLGDLFLNSDWGMHAYAWRSFGDDFKEFLKGCNAEYIVAKFCINWNQNGCPKKSWKFKENHLVNLVNALINELNKSIQP